MTGNRPKVGIACNKEVRERYFDEVDLARLEKFADVFWQEFDEATSWDDAPEASA